MSNNGQSIPSLDLSDFLQGGERKKQFVNDLGRAYETIGFVAIKNHYLKDEESSALYKNAEDFFSLSDEGKSKYEIEGLFGQRGYVGKGKEHAKGRSVGDLKEFYHVGQPKGKENGLPENISVNEFPGLLEHSLTVYKSLEDTGIEMLRAIALFLGLDENYFDDKIAGADSILRLIHYYPIQSKVEEGAVRAAEHGDINLITLLMGASAEGLEILSKNHEWIPVTAIPGHLVVNVGDMLERLTNNRLRSTIHRVVNPIGAALDKPRFSIPFFMHPRREVDLSCLPQCIDDENQKSYEDITAGEFLRQRLEEIGLKQ